MLKLLEIAYALRELGYFEEATGIFRTAAKEGEAGLKSGMHSDKIDPTKFAAMGEATTRAWEEAQAPDRLEAFRDWLGKRDLQADKS